jgi:hypothetical protein
VIGPSITASITSSPRSRVWLPEGVRPDFAPEGKSGFDEECLIS